MSRSNCTFCDLIHGAGEVSVCYEDADTMAFMDIQPVNAGHVLVAPKQHHATIFDVPQELGDHLFKVTMRMAVAVRNVTGCDDVNIVVSSGEAAGQDVFHHHVHIIPRRPGDGFEVQLPFGGSEMPDRTMLDAMAARIVTAMRDPMRAKGAGGGKREEGGGQGARPSAGGPRPDDAEAQMAGPASASSGPVATEREVALAFTHEGPAARQASQPADLRPQEGPHGELVREDTAAD